MGIATARAQSQEPSGRPAEAAKGLGTALTAHEVRVQGSTPATRKHPSYRAKSQEGYGQELRPNGKQLAPVRPEATPEV